MGLLSLWDDCFRWWAGGPSTMAAMQGRKSRMMRRGSLLRDPTRMMMDAGDDEGAGDCLPQ